MIADFNQHVANFRHRMSILRETFDRQGYLLARSERDPSYTILLHPSTDKGVAYAVHSFRDGQPVGHRDYDHPESSSPINSALQEFASEGFKLERLARPAKGVEWEQYAGRGRG